MKKILLILTLIFMFVMPVFSQTGSLTTNEYFYLPEYGAYGTDEFDEYNAYMEIADNQIESNKDGLTLRYLKTEMDSFSKLQTIISDKTLVNVEDGITATAITDGLILEVDLNADEDPADNDILTFDTTGDNFSWQTLTELGIAASGANTDITSIYNTSLKFGRDADNLIDFTTDNKIVFRTNAVNRMEITSTGELDMNAHGVGFTLGTATGDGATLINWQAGLKFKFTFGAQNETITFTDPSNPCSLLLIIVQDGTGSRTITWSGMTIKWPGGTVITLSTGANTEDAVGLFWDGTSYYAVGTNAFATP